MPDCAERAWAAAADVDAGWAGERRLRQPAMPHTTSSASTRTFDQRKPDGSSATSAMLGTSAAAGRVRILAKITPQRGQATAPGLGWPQRGHAAVSGAGGGEIVAVIVFRTMMVSASTLA